MKRIFSSWGAAEKAQQEAQKNLQSAAIKCDEMTGLSVRLNNELAAKNAELMAAARETEILRESVVSLQQELAEQVILKRRAAVQMKRRRDENGECVLTIGSGPMARTFTEKKA